MRKTFLMCRPDFYDVEYVINPHMEGNIHNVDKVLAVQQWENFHQQLSKVANVELIDPVPHRPDMVFTANAGLIVDNLAWTSSFSKYERRGEERFWQAWFIARGYDTVHIPHDKRSEFFFEGAGDCLCDTNGDYWLGYGPRTSQGAAERIVKVFGSKPFYLLNLVDPRFYHLDTCFCPLDKGHILCFSPAFSTGSFWHFASKHGRSSGVATEDPLPDMIIDVDEEDAMAFACNAVCVGDTIFMPTCSDDLINRLQKLGYNVIQVDMSEFIKAGGATKCLTFAIP